MRMRETNEELGEPDSLEGVTIGVGIPNPNLRLVRQRHHRQFVIRRSPGDRRDPEVRRLYEDRGASDGGR